MTRHCKLTVKINSRQIKIRGPSLVAAFQIQSRTPSVLLLTGLKTIRLGCDCKIRRYHQIISRLRTGTLVLRLGPLRRTIRAQNSAGFGKLLTGVRRIYTTLPIPMVTGRINGNVSTPLIGQLLRTKITTISITKTKNAS